MTTIQERIRNYDGKTDHDCVNEAADRIDALETQLTRISEALTGANKVIVTMAQTNTELHTKLETMEKQEPVAWMHKETGSIERYESFVAPYNLGADSDWTPLYAAPYDQQSLEPCAVCGWKAIIPGEPCLVCERKARMSTPVAWGMPDACGNIVDTITEDDRQRGMAQWADQYKVPLFQIGCVQHDCDQCRKVLTDAEIIEIAKRTQTADPGADGYILPVSFARAIESAVRGFV